MNTSFVTGATGFIGRRLVDRLLVEGHEVVALVRHDQHGLPSSVRTVRGDILVPESLTEAGVGCSHVFHLAASVSFDPKQRAELERVNATGTQHLLEAANTWRAQRTVVVSSAITLGLSSTSDRILDEETTADAQQASRNPYMASKLAAEVIALAPTVDGASDVVVVNPTTVYGPGDTSLNSGTLIGKVANGKVLPVPSGGGNVVDVDDVVRGILAASKRGVGGRRYVLGAENLSFAEIFDTVAKVVGKRPLMVPVPQWTRPLFGAAAGVLGAVTGGRFLTPQLIEDLFSFKYYSHARAQAELGWQPSYTFAESVQRAWAFYREQGLL